MLSSIARLRFTNRSRLCFWAGPTQGMFIQEGNRKTKTAGQRHLNRSVFLSKEWGPPQISNTLDTSFCLSTLNRALEKAKPEIFNSDQGAQFTSEEFTQRLETAGIVISMDGRGRALDNVFTERLWRSVKYEEVYLKDYDGVPDAIANLKTYFRFYNFERPHQSLDDQTPALVYFDIPRNAVKYQKP